jgi:hypothetical protein
MVASTKRQAEAMIAMLKLDPEKWLPVTYGEPVKNLFEHAKLVRPSDGVTRAHCDWVLGELLPNLCLSVTTVPPHWKIPQQHVD